MAAPTTSRPARSMGCATCGTTSGTARDPSPRRTPNCWRTCAARLHQPDRVSPWVVTLEALEPFRVPVEVQNPSVLPYLNEKNRQNFDIQLEVILKPQNTEGVKISHSNFKNMYWTVAQQIAHHTINGCNLNVGDVMASGTISGNSPDSFGSLLELTWGGKTPITLPDGSTCTFLEDGDTVVFRGFAEKNGIKVGFGEVKGMVLPAL